MTRNTTKRALLMSLLSMILCMTMLVGSTFAWFTDTATTGVNKITSGNLDVALEYSYDMSTWKEAEDAADIFSASDLWEPGFTKVVYFRVTNKGSLAVDFDVTTNLVKNETGINVAGGELDLTKYIQIGISFTDAKYADAETARAAVGTANPFGNIMSGEKTLASGEKSTFAFIAWMPEETGNVANHNGKNIPKIQFGIQVLANQAAVEGDSFGPNYDAEPGKPVPPTLDAIVAQVGTIDDLKTAIESALTQGSAETITINLEKDIQITAEDTWEPILPKGYSGVNKVVFNGNNHTIKGLTAPLMVGSFAGSGTITINDLTLEHVQFTSERYNGLGVGAFVAYSDASGGVSFNNCHLVNSQIECTDGYAGGFVGYSSSASLIFDGCTATGNVIKGGNSSAVLVGHAAQGVVASNCTINNNSVTYEIEDDWRVGAVVGTTEKGATLTNITAEGNTITQLNATNSQVSVYYGRNKSNTIPVTLDGAAI